MHVCLEVKPLLQWDSLIVDWCELFWPKKDSRCVLVKRPCPSCQSWMQWNQASRQQRSMFPPGANMEIHQKKKNSLMMIEHGRGGPECWESGWESGSFPWGLSYWDIEYQKSHCERWTLILIPALLSKIHKMAVKWFPFPVHFKRENVNIYKRCTIYL